MGPLCLTNRHTRKSQRDLQPGKLIVAHTTHTQALLDFFFFFGAGLRLTVRYVRTYCQSHGLEKGASCVVLYKCTLPLLVEWNPRWRGVYLSSTSWVWLLVLDGETWLSLFFPSIPLIPTYVHGCFQTHRDPPRCIYIRSSADPISSSLPPFLAHSFSALFFRCTLHSLFQTTQPSPSLL